MNDIPDRQKSSHFTTINHSQIVWQESNHHDETTVGIEVNDVKVVVSDKKKSNARYLAAKVCLVTF